MQCAKLPAPTTKVSNQISATEPVTEADPDTIHAAVAIIQPPITPDQKTVGSGTCAASVPSFAIASTIWGGTAWVSEIKAANAKAPSRLEGKTIAQSRAVLRTSLFSARINATGYKRVLGKQL